VTPQLEYPSMAATPLRPAEFPPGTTWSPLVRKWERSLRAENKSPNTIRIDTLAASQMATWMAGPTDVVPRHVRDFIADVLARTNAGNAHTIYRSLRVFFAWLVTEEEIDRTPMDRTKAPIVPEKQVPILPDDLTKDLLGQCSGRDLISRRDTAIIRLLFDTGGWLRLPS
jgi:site-specific recombinase XerC